MKNYSMLDGVAMQQLSLPLGQYVVCYIFTSRSSPSSRHPISYWKTQDPALVLNAYTLFSAVSCCLHMAHKRIGVF